MDLTALTAAACSFYKSFIVLSAAYLSKASTFASRYLFIASFIGSLTAFAFGTIMLSVILVFSGPLANLAASSFASSNFNLALASCSTFSFCRASLSLAALASSSSLALTLASSS